VLAVALALLAPASAFAATEFSLGGFIKLNTFWDSTQNNLNLTNAVARDNNASFHHGRFNMASQETRINFTMKGPKLWGAQTSGILEMSFDGATDNASVSSSGTWQARVRLAMFRLNWPETELMMGQYHSILATWQVDAAELSALEATGTVTARLPQIRLTQKFAGDWSVAGMLGLPNNANLTNADPYGAGTGGNGADAETPQLQGVVKYEHDWWGKAAYFGVPAPFAAWVAAGWQRNINRAASSTLAEFGQDNYAFSKGNLINQRFVNPWMVQGALFIPVVPTHSVNLAGTASILTQWFVGQGVEAFGVTGNASNLYKEQANGTFDPSLLNRFGGFVEGEYYFTNQWYLNAAYGISRAFGVSRNDVAFLASGAGTTASPYAASDQFRTMQQVDATLWYRPIQALKFGVQYSFAHSDYFQRMPSAANFAGATVGTPNYTNAGNEHRVQFVGLFFF
ncbi:MAG TPA: hypothetical protein VIN67_00305, partial [Desulfobaccales bacterium]